MNEDQFVERHIIIGCIISTDYIREISKVWESRFLESATARVLSSWCLDYYTQYQQAPGKDIENIYIQKLKEQKIGKDQAADIEEILSGLSDEYERGQFNTQYLLDQTHEYFQKQNLKLFVEDIKGELTSGKLMEAERLAGSYHPVKAEQINSIDPFASAEKIKEVFTEREKPLIHFGKALGEFWNQEMTRDAFIALMGPEKRGKSFFLMEIGLRANRSGCNVAFFQAGDMTENQYIMRQCIYLTKRPHREKYCSGVWIPTLDCRYNQMDTCDKEEREGAFKIFEEDEEINFEALVDVAKNNPEYKVCRNCKEMKGAVWLVPNPPTNPLTWKEAYKSVKQWKKRYKKRFRLSTYANETLSVSEIKTMLDIWEQQDDFVPDVIIIDYADLLTSDPDVRGLDFRNRQNVIWQRLRALSQQRHCLIVTATQAAASSYGKKLMTMADFSEDKRKYAHVTALYGLNQTNEEKQIGIMRINPIVVREDEFTMAKPVHVLQRLQIGRPVLESYF